MNAMNVTISLTKKETARYLTEMGMYKVFNDFMFPPLPLDKDEEPLNKKIWSLYNKLLEEFNKAYPVEMPAIARKVGSRFWFKNLQDFVSSFEEYFEKRLVAACLSETAKHPKWTKEKVSAAVSKKGEQIFEQSLLYVYNDIMYHITEQKIMHGERPSFDF